MSTPSTITQRLETQHPELLPEVVTDLQLLRWEKLCERISQWMLYLSDILSEWWIAEDVATLTMIQSPRNQLAFLEEHLEVYEIIAVLISVDPSSPLLEKYLRQLSEITIEHEHVGETIAVWAYANYMTWDFCLPIICKDLTTALKLLLDKRQQCVWLPPTFHRQLMRWSTLFAQIITETRDTMKYKKAIGLYELAQEELAESWFESEYAAIDLMMWSARVYRNCWQMDEAFASYTRAREKSLELLDVLESKEVTDWSCDPFYTQWETFLLQQHHDDATKMLLLSGLFLLQITLEDIQNNAIKDEENTLLAVQYDLDEAYEVLKNKGWISPWVASAYEVANVWRFTYGWYMMLLNEQIYARQELHLLDKKATPFLLYTAKKHLLDWWGVSFVETTRMEPTVCKIVSLARAQ